MDISMDMSMDISMDISMHTAMDIDTQQSHISRDFFACIFYEVLCETSCNALIMGLLL